MGDSWERKKYFKQRVFPSYEAYVAKQKEKLNHHGWRLVPGSEQDGLALEARLGSLGVVDSGMTVLCLGARLGHEVKAFIDLGCFAVGIDLNPGAVEIAGGNKYVVYGDFHDLQYADGSVDVVYTNSVDHVHNLEKFCSEVQRVSKPEALFIVETVPGTAEGWYAADSRDCFTWDHLDDLVSFFERWFVLVKRYDAGEEQPSCGLLFRNREAPLE